MCAHKQVIKVEKHTRIRQKHIIMTPQITPDAKSLVAKQRREGLSLQSTSMSGSK